MFRVNLRSRSEFRNAPLGAKRFLPRNAPILRTNYRKLTYTLSIQPEGWANDLSAKKKRHHWVRSVIYPNGIEGMKCMLACVKGGGTELLTDLIVVPGELLLEIAAQSSCSSPAVAVVSH